MKYAEVISGAFLSRYKRFSADVRIDGRIETVHVGNTGRCAELFVPHSTVYLAKAQSGKNRRTAYDLVAVEKSRAGEGLPPLLINLDSLAPNRAVEEWLEGGGFFPDLTLIRREVTHGDSRFDFYVETATGRAFIEVKGVTLESGGIAMFPDAPTERGVKHINGLISCLDEGYAAYIIFVIQMKGITLFRPNDATHKAFGDALRRASAAGVGILAVDCDVSPEEMKISSPVTVEL